MHASFALGAAFLSPPLEFWPYLAGGVLLLLGLVVIGGQEMPQAQGLDKAIIFGRLFLAIPMAVFGAYHFIVPRFVAGIIPSWIPGHLFWTYFVGTALIGSAVSIVLKWHAALSATLLGFMLLCFVLILHTPRLALQPGDRFSQAVLLRDLGFSGGALAFGVSQMRRMAADRSRRMLILVRYMIGVPAVFFGVQHFLHPQYVPAVPLDRLMPAYIPAHFFIGYLTGSALLVCGVSILVNWRARLAAAWLGIVVFAIVMLVYLPIMLATPGDVNQGLNYFADTLAFSGAVLVLAEALPKAGSQESAHGAPGSSKARSQEPEVSSVAG